MNHTDMERDGDRENRMTWWREAKFGMFIHWGLYAVPAGTYGGKEVPWLGEWIMNRAQIPVAEYEQYAKAFDPTRYDPEAWVMLAKDTGMKYLVITTKHHDGFALFDSAVSDWNVVRATPYGRDLLRPLAEACRKHGMKLGFYYSQAQDWYHPGGEAVREVDDPDNPGNRKWATGGQWDDAQSGDFDEYINRVAIPQVREILSNYGDIVILWWDVPNGMTPERARAFLPLLELQPGIITNDRLGGEVAGDLKTPEQEIPATGLDYDWETCMTMNDTWGFKRGDINWKSAVELLHNLVDIASKGGNFLLNVGPTADGDIPQPSVDCLRTIGRWMKLNGQSIYGTTASPLSRTPWGRCTKKTQPDGATRLFLHVFDWPTEGELVVEEVTNVPEHAYLLADPEVAPLVCRRSDAGLVISLPSSAPDPLVSVIALIGVQAAGHHRNSNA